MGILGLFIAWALTRHTVLTAFEPGFLQFLGITIVRYSGQEMRGSGITVWVVKLVKEAEKVGVTTYNKKEARKGPAFLANHNQGLSCRWVCVYASKS